MKKQEQRTLKISGWRIYANNISESDPVLNEQTVQEIKNWLSSEPKDSTLTLNKKARVVIHGTLEGNRNEGIIENGTNITAPIQCLASKGGELIVAQNVNSLIEFRLNDEAELPKNLMGVWVKIKDA